MARLKRAGSGGVRFVAIGAILVHKNAAALPRFGNDVFHCTICSSRGKALPLRIVGFAIWVCGVR